MILAGRSDGLEELGKRSERSHSVQGRNWAEVAVAKVQGKCAHAKTQKVKVARRVCRWMKTFDQ